MRHNELVGARPRMIDGTVMCPSLKLEFDNSTGMISILHRNKRKREGKDNGIQLS
jgi:hypothetical protein